MDFITVDTAFRAALSGATGLVLADIASPDYAEEEVRTMLIRTGIDQVSKSGYKAHWSFAYNLAVQVDIFDSYTTAEHLIVEKMNLVWSRLETIKDHMKAAGISVALTFDSCTIEQLEVSASETICLGIVSLTVNTVF